MASSSTRRSSRRSWPRGSGSPRSRCRRATSLRPRRRGSSPPQCTASGSWPSCSGTRSTAGASGARAVSTACAPGTPACRDGPRPRARPRLLRPGRVVHCPRPRRLRDASAHARLGRPFFAHPLPARPTRAPGPGRKRARSRTDGLCSGAVAVFVYAARRLHSVSDAARPAAALALLYLVNPSLHGINIRDIHPQAFAIAFLVWAAAAFDARRYGWCAFALLLTLGGREDAAIAVVGFGLWLALARRRWALGVTVLAASLLVLLIDLTWVMPYFRGSPYPHLGRYSHLGASLPEILVTLVVRPWRWVPVVLTLPKLAYLAAMLAPLGFLPLLAPRALAAALPGLAMNLLSLDPVLFNYRSQYQSFVLPFFVLASVDGYARLRQWRASEAGGGGGARPLPSRLLSPTAVLAFGFLASAVLTARTVNDFMVTRWWPNDDRRAAGALMREIPADVAVSVNERLVPHLATRREVYIFPTGVDTSRWILDRVGEVAKTPPAGFTLHHREDGWVLLRRGE